MIKNLLITGAGVDCTKGIEFPMAATLLPEIAAYIEGQGKPVDQTLRSLLPNLRFTFASMVARAVDAISTRGADAQKAMVQRVQNVIDELPPGREDIRKHGELIVRLFNKLGMSKSNKIGMVGGFPIPEVNRLMNAFMAGAKEVNPKVEFSVSFINSWFDPPKAKEAAFAMIDKGADVMYAERFGVSDAAKEKGKLAIGNVINTQPQYPDTVVASALWHMEPSIDRAIKLVKDGKFTAEDYGPYSMMKHKGSSLAPLGTFEKKVPADVVAKVKAKEKAIVDGKFAVKIDDSQPKSTAK